MSTEKRAKKTTGDQLKARREKVAQCLRKGLRSPTAISTVIGETVRTVKWDIRHLQKESDVWLTNLAMGGYVHDVSNAVQALEDLEVQLYAMRDEKDIKPWLKLKIIHMIQESIALRVNIETKGPVLMKLKQIRDKITAGEKLAVEVKTPDA